MKKGGPYDFPPKEQKSEGDEASVTQPGRQPGEDSGTADQGAGVPVQHQSSGSEFIYRLFQPSHHAVQLAPLSPQLESASSFTPVQSVPSSPFKQSSPHFTRIPSVPNPYESPGRIPSGSSTRSFVSTPRDPSTQVPLSPSYRTPQSKLSTQSFTTPPDRFFQTSQSTPLESTPPNLESTSSFTPGQSGPSVPFSQPYQPFRGPQSAPSSPFKRSSPGFTRSFSVPTFVFPNPSQSDSRTPSESMTQLSVSTQFDASGHVPLSPSYRSPESYPSSESHRSSQSSLPPEYHTSSRPQQDYSFHQQSQAQSFNEQLQPLHSQQPQLQTYQDQPTLTQSQSYQQPQLYDQLQYFSTQQLDVPGTTGTAASSPASQSPQLSMIEQFQLSQQPQALHSQQPQLQTYQPFQTHQQFQPYQQLKPHDQSRYFSTQQPQQADLTRAGGTFASSASPQHHQRQYLPERASGPVASHTSFTKQGSMQNVPQSPSKKALSYYRYQNQCNDCKECFKTPQNLKNHKTSVHKMKNCNIENCCFETNDDDELKSHQVQIHVGQLDTHNIRVPAQGAARPVAPTSSDPAPSHSSSQQDNVGTSTIVKCDIDNCSTICIGERGLMVQRNLKHPEKTSRDCGFRARVEKVYYDHVIQNHPNSVAAAEANAIRTNFPNPNPQPPVSTTAANSSQHNLPPAQGQPTNTGRNQCQVCGEQKTSKYLLGIHEKMHLEHKCESCTTFYKNAEELDWHKKSVFHTSGGNLIINCQQCHADFKTLPEFKAHCENFVMTPGKDKILLCPICGYPSGTMENLRGHYYRFGDEHYDDSNVRRRDRDDDSDRKSGGGGGRQQSATN